MCWKSFLFSVLSTEGTNFSLLPLQTRPIEKARTRLQNSSKREISQPPPSFASLFLIHSQNYHLILFYWLFNNKIDRNFVCFFSSEDFQEASLKSRTGAIFPLYARPGEILPGAHGDLSRVFHKHVTSHLSHFWPKPGPAGGAGWRHNIGDAETDFSSPEPSFQLLAWACWSAELSLCRHPEVGNKEDIVSGFPCKNKSLVILAKCHVSRGTCWFYEVGLSNRKVDWLTPRFTRLKEKKATAFQLWCMPNRPCT